MTTLPWTGKAGLRSLAVTATGTPVNVLVRSEPLASVALARRNQSPVVAMQRDTVTVPSQMPSRASRRPATGWPAAPPCAA